MSEEIECDASYMEVSVPFYNHTNIDELIPGWKVFNRDDFLIFHHESEYRIMLSGKNLDHRNVSIYWEANTVELGGDLFDDNGNFSANFFHTTIEKGALVIHTKIKLSQATVMKISEAIYLASESYKKFGGSYEKSSY